MIRLALTILDFGMILLMIYIVHESYYEHESQATLISLLGVAFHIALLYVILYIPGSQIVPIGYFGLLGTVGLIFLIPRTPNITTLKGIRGDAIGDAPRQDERDSVTRRYQVAGQSQLVGTKGVSNDG